MGSDTSTCALRRSNNAGITGKPQTFFSELALILGACGFDTAVGFDGSQAAAGEAPPTALCRKMVRLTLM